jgi:hypothetical protein
MRHYVTFMIVSLKIAEDIMQSISNHVLSKTMQGACIGLLKEFLAADNLPEFIEQCKSIEKTGKLLEQKADEWGESFKSYLKATGVDKMCDDIFEADNA